MDASEIYLPLKNLCDVIKSRGYPHRTYFTLRRYAKHGVTIGARTIRLETKMINNQLSSRLIDYENFIAAQVDAQKQPT